jgi:hypothetical protein
MRMTWEQVEDIAIENKLAQLGEPTAEFAVSGVGFVRNLVLAPLLIGAGLTLEVVLIGLLRVHHYELLLLGVVLVLSGVTLVVRAFRNRGLRVLVFPEGLMRLLKGEVQALCWEEVDQVWQKKSTGAHWAMRAWRGALTLTVQAADGRRMTFDDSLPRLAELCQMVCRETLPLLWPQARAAYDAGNTLEFGKLRINRQGLSQGKETVPWSEVQKVKINAAQLLIYKKGKWTHSLAVTVSEIPNSHVLLALLGQLVRVEK